MVCYWYFYEILMVRSAVGHIVAIMSSVKPKSESPKRQLQDSNHFLHIQL